MHILPYRDHTLFQAASLRLRVKTRADARATKPGVIMAPLAAVNVVCHQQRGICGGPRQEVYPLVADGVTPEELRSLQAHLTPEGQKLFAELMKKAANGVKPSDLIALAAKNLGMRSDELLKALQDPKQLERLSAGLLGDAARDAAALRALLAKAGLKVDPRPGSGHK